MADNETLEELLPEGSIIGNRFEVKGKLAETGFSVLYNGVNIDTNEMAALKVQNPDYMEKIRESNPTLESVLHQMFYKEETILNALDHPGIPKSYGLFFHRQPDNSKIPVRAMEYVPSHLDSFFKDKLFLPALADFLIQFSSILSYIHDNGIIHGDIKPQNIMCNGGKIKLIDFNTASHAIGDCPKQWLKGSIKNSPDGYCSLTRGYAAPEVKDGERPVFGSDIYSLSRVIDKILIAHKMNNFLMLKDSRLRASNLATVYEDPLISSTLIGPYDPQAAPTLVNTKSLFSGSTIPSPLEPTAELSAEEEQGEDQDKILVIQSMLNLPTCLDEFYRQCTSQDPKKRLSASEINDYGKKLLEASRKPMYINI